MRKVIFLFCVQIWTSILLAQTPKTSLLVVSVPNITTAYTTECGGVAMCLDNRSTFLRNSNYHSVSATGTGTWQVQIQFANGSPSGFSSCGTAATITQASNPAIAYCNGYYDYILVNITGANASTVVANYTGQNQLYLSSATGSVSFPLNITQGGTNATTSAGALSNLLNGNAQGTYTNKVQMAGTNSGATGAPLCNDSSGNTTTSGCPTGPIIQVSNYKWATQTPGTTWTAGQSNSITLSPCPAGFSFTSSGGQAATPVYIAGTGTPEAILPTGGSTSGPNCTVILSATNVLGNAVGAHSAGWTAGPAIGGANEATNAACAAGGGTVLATALTLQYATWQVLCSNITLQMVGPYATPALERHGDFGSTIQVGLSSAGVNNVKIQNFYVTNPDTILPMGSCPGVNCGRLQNSPATITSPLTQGSTIEINRSNTIYVDNIRAENMPHGITITDSSVVTVTNTQIRGVWDYANSGTQLSVACFEVNDSSGLGLLPTYITGWNDHCFGYGSIARTVTINSNNVTMNESVGPKYGWLFNTVEVADVSGGSYEAMDYYAFYLQAQTSKPLLRVSVHDLPQCDGNRISCWALDNTGATTQTIEDVQFSNNNIGGGDVGQNCGQVINAGAGLDTVYGLAMSGGSCTTTFGSGFLFFDGYGISAGSGVTHGYNDLGVYPTNSPTDQTGNSAYYFGGRSHNYVVVGNTIGGSETFSGTNTLNGVGDFGTNGVVYPNVNAGVTMPNGWDPAFTSKAFAIRTATNENAQFSSAITITGAVSLSAKNDALSSLVPFEYQASEHDFTSGAINPSFGIGQSTKTTLFSAVFTPPLPPGVTSNSTTDVAGKIWWSQLNVPFNTTFTGVCILNGATVGTDKWIFGLYNAAGTLVANTALAGVLTANASKLQCIDFTGTYNAVGPQTYFLAVQGNGTTDNFQSYPANGASKHYGTGSQAGSFGTLASITPTNVFTSNVGPLFWPY